MSIRHGLQLGPAVVGGSVLLWIWRGAVRWARVMPVRVRRVYELGV